MDNIQQLDWFGKILWVSEWLTDGQGQSHKNLVINADRKSIKFLLVGSLDVLNIEKLFG